MSVLKTQTAKLGALTARIVDAVDDDDAAARPTLLCVLCHGYGAPGTDLVGIAGEMVRALPELGGKVRFVFPEAPLALEHVPFGGRAWWHIDIGRFERAIATGRVQELLEDTPEGLGAARKALLSLLDVAMRDLHIDMRRVVLGGFSQGAMLATDTALRADERPAGLIVWSGTVLSLSAWQELATKRAGLPVVVTHGTHDPLLPYAGAELLKSLLDGAGLDVRFHAFPGGHGLDERCIELGAELLARLTA